jgi:hypothetical protein
MSRLLTVNPPSEPLYAELKISGHVPSARCANAQTSIVPADADDPMVMRPATPRCSSLFVALLLLVLHRPTVRPDEVASDAKVIVYALLAR